MDNNNCAEVRRIGIYRVILIDGPGLPLDDVWHVSDVRWTLNYQVLFKDNHVMIHYANSFLCSGALMDDFFVLNSINDFCYVDNECFVICHDVDAMRWYAHLDHTTQK